MRTTLNIDDELLMAAKIAAIERRSTLTAVVEAGLRTELARRSSQREDDLEALRALGPFPTRKGRPKRAFDWVDSSALVEELEGPLARS